MPRLVIAAATAATLTACANPQDDRVLTTDLANTFDIKVVGDTLYSLQYDGSIATTSVRGGTSRIIVPAQRALGDGDPGVYPDTYELLVAGPDLYWTTNQSGAPEVRHAVLDASGGASAPEVAFTAPTPIADLELVGGRACWTEPLRIACVDVGGQAVTTLALAAGPIALTENAGVVYWLTSGTAGGALVAYDPVANAATTLVSGISDPRGMAVRHDGGGDTMVYLDAGSCTQHDGVCDPDGNGTIHELTLDGPDADVLLTRQDGIYQIDSNRVVAAGTSVFYAGNADLWRAGDTLEDADGVEVGNVGCNAIAASETEAYCADWHDALRAYAW